MNLSNTSRMLCVETFSRPDHKSLKKLRLSFVFTLCVVIASLLSIATTEAQTVQSNWLNAADGDWTVAMNWSSANSPDNDGTLDYDVTVNSIGSPYEINVDSDITINDLTLDSTDATVTLSGNSIFSISGDVNLDAGRFNLSNGTIFGGTINQDADGQLVVATSRGGTLDGTTVNGDLNLNNDFAGLRLINGATFQDNANLNGQSSNLSTNTDTTLDQTINLTGNNTRFGTNGAAELTLDTDAQVNLTGRASALGSVGSSGGTIINMGTVTVDRADAADTTTKSINPTVFNNQGTVDIINSSTLQITGEDGWSNTGTYEVSDGSTLNVAGNFENASLGTVNNSAGGTVNLTGTVTTTDVANINNSGMVRLMGTLDNSEETLDFSQGAFGDFEISNGTIFGGTINQDAGGQLVVATSRGGTLDGTTVNGDLNLNNDFAGLRLINGATFQDNANLNGQSSNLSTNTDTTLDQTINLTGNNTRFGTNGAAELTLDTDAQVNLTGRASTLGSVGSSGGTIINMGTVTVDRADAADTTTKVINPTVFNNQGTVEAINGGRLQVSPGSLNNLVNSTLTGGTWSVGASSRLDLQSGLVTSNAAEIVLDGPGSIFNTSSSPTLIEESLVTNTVDGTLRVLGGRDYDATNAGSFTNAGTVELGGGNFTSPALTNDGEVFGFGSVTPSISNTGTVRASGGTLTSSGIQGSAGTVQVDSDGGINLSAAPAGSTAGNLIHNGSATDSLNLGGNDIVVSNDYNNANFGSGNSFQARANVAGSGQILADGDVTQTLSGDVTNGTTNAATLSFGNVHVGDVNSLTYQVNNAGTTGPSIRGAVQNAAGGGNITDSQLSGAGVTAGNFDSIAAGGDSGDLTVTYNATRAGLIDGGQVVNITNNFDNVADQTLSITNSAAYRFAEAADVASETIDFGIVHVGDVLTAEQLTISNTAIADVFSEDLQASNFTATSDAIISSGSPNSINLIAGETSNSLGLLVDTASAGFKTGSVSLDFTSTGEVMGTTIDGLGVTDLNSDSVAIVAQVNEFANAAFTTVSDENLLFLMEEDEYVLDFGDVLQGDSIFTQLGLLNDIITGPADELAGDFETIGDAFVYSNFNEFSNLLAGDQLSGLIVDFDTSTIGAFSGQILLNPLSENSSGFSGSQNQVSINITGNVVAIPEPTTASLLLLAGTVVVARSRRR